ncbi:MAG: hypothetical protein NW201_11995 [Gemmatimonadales bacterium]|nr:hypothetical protein [Gemmatimonadales bacterium]
MLSIAAGRGSAGGASFTFAAEAAGGSGAGAAVLAGETWLEAGTWLHQRADGDRSLLLEAARCYQAAVRDGLTRERTPEAWALAQNNLALAYLAIPAAAASDQLRLGVAIQALREALQVYGRETHPAEWASAQGNLANALQYLPSTHPEQNLQQAVQLYDELLEVRRIDADPVGHALVLANRANALAHLGLFQPSLDGLRKAYDLFHLHGRPDEAAAMLEQVEAINAHRATLVARD